MFQAQIDKCLKRIESLRFLSQDSPDELDTLATSMLGISSDSILPSKSTQNEKIEFEPRRKRFTDKSLKILKFIGREGKSLRELVTFCQENAMNMTDANLRNFAMQYRGYGLIDSETKGFYKLTEFGMESVQKQEIGQI